MGRAELKKEQIVSRYGEKGGGEDETLGKGSKTTNIDQHVTDC